MSEDKIGGEKAILEERRKKLENLRDKGVAYANSFRPKNSANEIHKLYSEPTKDDLDKKKHDKKSYKKYIKGSAEAVGLMCLKVFCNNNSLLYNELKQYAINLGSVFQKVNFIR